jgi:hypothetical protein
MYRSFEKGHKCARKTWAEFTEKEKDRELAGFLKCSFLPVELGWERVWRRAAAGAHKSLDDSEEASLRGLSFGFHEAAEEYRKAIGKTE